jgi:hypothetical protein
MATARSKAKPLSNTVKQLSEKKPRKKQENRNTSGLEPFAKGYDPRRNLKGRPKSFDQLRALAQDIAEQIATKADGTPLKWNGQEITFAEFVLLSWVTDKKYLEKFVDVAYGKVPQPVDVTSGGEKIQNLPPDQVAQKVAALMELAKTRKEEENHAATGS